MKVLLEAPILTNSGYGEHSRLVFTSLLARPEWNLDIYVNPLEWGNTSWMTTDSEIKKSIDSHILKQALYMQKSKNNPEYDIHIHVGIPSEFQKKAPFSVCVTAGIESTKVSPEWILKTYQGIDKIIVPSEHAKQSFLNPTYQGQDQSGKEMELVCNSPIEVVPYPVKIFSDKSEKLNIDFETSFNFLMVAMWGVRKNLEKSIRWFVEKFRTNDDVGLIVKTSMSKNSILDRRRTKDTIQRILNKCGKRQCKVYLLHGNLSESEIHSIYEHEKIKAFISATHGEGYGLPIFEAAYSGVPVVATDWSGHLDFLVGEEKEGSSKNSKLFAKVDYRLAPIQKEAVWDTILVGDSQWAYPIENSFKNEMQNVYKNYDYHLKRAKKLQNTIFNTHSQENISKAMSDALIPDRFRPNSETAQWISELEEMVNA